ncbi:MAG: hypothetical protein ABW101_13975 [Candidatus Thiodiazotropha sp.]
MIEFTCIGYDIREWPCKGYISADATEWELYEEFIDNAKTEVGTYSNHFQLLEICSNDEFDRLVKYVTSKSDVSLVSVEAPTLVVNALREQKEWCINENYPCGKDWDELGCDVCDIDGFFSILHMGVPQIKKRSMYKEDELLDAFVLAQAANILVPSHAPFIVLKLKALRGHP